jgi:hypothetical protein
MAGLPTSYQTKFHVPGLPEIGALSAHIGQSPHAAEHSVNSAVSLEIASTGAYRIICFSRTMTVGTNQAGK